MVIPVDFDSLPVVGLITLPSTYALAGKSEDINCRVFETERFIFYFNLKNKTK